VLAAEQLAAEKNAAAAAAVAGGSAGGGGGLQLGKLLDELLEGLDDFGQLEGLIIALGDKRNPGENNTIVSF
jgi:hypothetical protein